MIVCVCRAVCDRQLRQLAGDGLRTLDQIERACGAGGDCGTCLPDIERIVEESALVRPMRACAHPSAAPARASDETAVPVRIAAVRSAA